MRLDDMVEAEIEQNWDGGESVRWQLKLEALLHFERDSGITALYNKWLRACSGQAVPRRGGFDCRAALAHHGAADLGFIVLERNRRSRMMRSDEDFVALEDAIPNSRERECLMHDVRAVLMQGWAGYYHVDQVIDGTRSLFSRLLLPVANFDDIAVEVLMAENHTVESVLAGAAK